MQNKPSGTSIPSCFFIAIGPGIPLGTIVPDPLGTTALLEAAPGAG
jgi:hypothetical protein